MSAEEKLLAFENLMGEVGAALGEMADTLKKRDPAGAEIGQALTELVALLEKRKALDLGELVKAVQQLRLTTTVHVEPTPIQICVQPAAVHVEIQPAPQSDTVWELRIAGQYGAPDRVMELRRRNA